MGEFQSLVEKLDEMTAEAQQNASTKGGISPTGFTSPYSVGLFGQIRLSVKRSFMNKYRQPTVIRSYFMMYLIMSLILGTLYFQLGDSQSDARNRVALIYFCIVFCALGAITAIPGIIFGRAVYYREKPAFLRPFAYFVAQVLAEIPLVLVSVFVFGTIVYMMCLTTFTCTAYAMAVASCVETTEVANTIVGVSSSMFSLFAGFIIPKGSIPNYWIWLHYLSYYKYPLEALSINEMVGQVFQCTETEDVYILVNNTYVSYCPIQDGTDFLSQYFTMNTTYAFVGADSAVLVVYLSLFIIATYLGIKYINHLKR